MRLLVTARRVERLTALCEQVRRDGGSIVQVAGDITDDNLRRLLLARCIDEFGGLDILVNNAGIGRSVRSFPVTLRHCVVFSKSIFLPPRNSRAIALPELAKGNSPLLVNVGSVLGHRAVPNKSEYCSSKFALHGFSDALRAELWRQGIHLLLVSPSTTDSEFFDSVISHTPAEDDPQARSPRAENSTHFSARPFRGMSADRVAGKIVRAMRGNRAELILSAGGRSLIWLDRIMATPGQLAGAAVSVRECFGRTEFRRRAE